MEKLTVIGDDRNPMADFTGKITGKIMLVPAEPPLLTMETLRQQLAEQVPDAIIQLAKLWDVTPLEFQKLVINGQVTMEEVILRQLNGQPG